MSNEPVAPEHLLGRLSQASAGGGAGSVRTVVIAFTANLLVAIAKTAAAVMTGSASVLAEAAHSWADTGNEIFLLVANRRSRRPPDRAHPLGHGREAYVWSLLAAVGLFVAGGAVSITHGIQELVHPEPADEGTASSSSARPPIRAFAPPCCSSCWTCRRLPA